MSDGGPEVGVGPAGGANRGFLSVADAARALGLSRLRVREAAARGLLPVRRDNRGHLRVDVEGASTDLAERLAGPPPPAVIDGLFDEIAELSDLLAEREAEVGRTRDLAARQDQALERAEALIGAAPASANEQTERALAMLDRSIGQLEAARAENARLTDLIERTLETTGRMEAALDEREAVLRDREAALERLLSLAERGIAGSADHAPGGFWSRLTGRRARGPAGLAGSKA